GLKFQGGKGLAVAFGGLAGMGMWPALLVFGLIWAPNYFLIWSKNMNIAVIAGAVGVAVYALITHASLGLVLMAAVIILKHFMALRAKETTQPSESKA
ncbi:MAG: glycerol-3-phosphate acyltransferase, partial [Anaerolineaceae bacterium]